MNILNYRIVKFSNGKFGLKRGYWGLCDFYDFCSPNSSYWWLRSDMYFTDCQVDDIETVRKKYDNLLNREPKNMTVFRKFSAIKEIVNTILFVFSNYKIVKDANGKFWLRRGIFSHQYFNTRCGGWIVSTTNKTGSDNEDIIYSLLEKKYSRCPINEIWFEVVE